MTKLRGYLCTYQGYEYKGLEIEKEPTGPPWWPMKKSGEPYKRLPAEVKTMLDEFYALPDEEKNACYVGGGCIPVRDNM